MNYDFLIGRQGSTNNLMVMSKGQVMNLDTTGSVPNTVSRLKPEEGTAHCRISIDDVSVKVENLNMRNRTYVDNRLVDGICEVAFGSEVYLGPDRFPVNMSKLLSTIKYTPAFAIDHLESVWQKYDSDLLALQLEQSKNQNQQRLQGILSQMGMLCMVIPMCLPSLAIPNWVRAVVIVLALAMGIFFYIRGSREGNSFVVKKRKLDKRLKEEYICPNPKCRYHFGAVDFDNSLRNRSKCPNCGVKFIYKGGK